MTTCASGTIIENEYRGETVRAASFFEVGGQLHLGLTEPTLLEPIDYDAELAERRKTHEPHIDVDENIGNSAFGI